MADEESSSTITFPRSTTTTAEEDAATAAETERIEEILDLIADTNGLPSIDDIKEYILSQFSKNAQTILQDESTPIYNFFDTFARLTQINAGLIKKHCAAMLYTQSTGDELSLAAANYGFTRIEAKPSTLTITITTSKDITLDSGTSFTDGAGTIWLTTAEVDIPKDTPTNVSVQTQDNGAISYVEPMSATNNIAGLSSIEVDSTSIVSGRDQESDTELKDVISSGSLIGGSDDACKRALLQLQMVSSAYVRTNPYDYILEVLGVQIDSRHRYVAVRISNLDLSQEEADLVANSLVSNTIYGGIYQPPESGTGVRACFGIDEDMLTQPTSDGGAGLDTGINEDSYCILDRITMEYGNFIDVYFYLARPTEIVCNVGIRYKNTYTTTEKENMSGEIKTQIATAVAELSQVGAQLLTSQIVARLINNTDLEDKLSIQSMTLIRYDEQIGGEATQALDAEPFEYFSIYDDNTSSYAGVIVSEE